MLSACGGAAVGAFVKGFVVECAAVAASDFDYDFFFGYFFSYDSFLVWSGGPVGVWVKGVWGGVEGVGLGQGEYSPDERE